MMTTPQVVIGNTTRRLLCRLHPYELVSLLDPPLALAGPCACMLETAVALAFGIPSRTSPCRPTRWSAHKARPQVLLLHVAIVAAVSWAALGFALQPLLILLIAGSHFAIDWPKLRFGNATFGPFAADQAAHLAMIALGAALFPGAYAAGLWAHLDAAAGRRLALAAAAMALGAGLRRHGLGRRLRGPGADGRAHARPTPASLPKGGRLIGRLERAMILMLVLADQPDGIGFLIAAKSLLRFNELARDQDRRVQRVRDHRHAGELRLGPRRRLRHPRWPSPRSPLEAQRVPHYLRTTSSHEDAARCSAFPASRPSP